MFSNKKRLIFKILILIVILLLFILGIIGFISSSIIEGKKNSEIPKNSEGNTDESTKSYYENFEDNMNLYFDKGGYFTETYYCNDGNFIKYKIQNKFDLYLSVNFNVEKYVSSNVLYVDFSCKDSIDYAHLQYVTRNTSTFAIDEIAKDGTNFKIKQISTYTPNDEAYKDIRKRYLSRIDSIKENYKTRYDALNPGGNVEENPKVQVFEHISKRIFIEELNADSLLLKCDSLVINTDVLQIKILYYDNEPILYYWKSDGYWYRYDYYNKKEPVTTKIDLDYIIDVKQFTYDTGETIPLFVDIEGNLKEFTE